MKNISCVSCGAKITNGCKKVSTPIHVKGSYSGKKIKCCSNPDFRECPNQGCENHEYDSTALICKNCGYYFGYETW